MGYYYEGGGPGEERPPGCLDAIAITRAVFAGLFWPIAAMIGAIVGLAFTVWLLLLHPALALIPVAVLIAGLFALTRWERRRRPPEG